MNLIQCIKELLGGFWRVIFKGYDFILGVENLLVIIGKRLLHLYEGYIKGSGISDMSVSPQDMPFVIYIPKDETSRHACVSYDAILAVGSTAGIGDEDPDSGYLGTSKYRIPNPHMITDHAVDIGVTLLSGIDFVCGNSQIMFLADPATLGFTQVILAGPDGMPRQYYKMFGWSKPAVPTHDAVAGFYGDAMSPYADLVWDIHVNGASLLTTKDLLASVTGCVVCTDDGAVDRLWVEQNYQHALIRGRIYSAPASLTCRVSAGDSVSQGDVVFGDIRFAGAGGDDYSDIGVMQVRTDAGTMCAKNETMNAYVVGGHNVLPLVSQEDIRNGYEEGTGPHVDKYKARCGSLSGDDTVPYVEIPASVNPFRFILDTIRRGRGLFISVVCENVAALSGALRCIRRNSNAGGMLDVYVSAEGDTVGVTMSDFTAEAGNAAVSVDATITVMQAAAAAEVTL